MPASRVEESSAATKAGGEPGLGVPGLGIPGFSLYVHWPFCVSKCPYCDFNSHVAEAVDHARWRRALLDELEHFRAMTPGRTLASIFFGGGTPSLMEPATAAAVIDKARAGWPVAADLEITLEANPSSVEVGRFRELRAAGVNRLSLGVQSLRDEALGFLGRGHRAAAAKKAIATAAGTFGRFSFDLIYGLPGQAPGHWRRELADALALAGGHLSCYQLAIEPGTQFHRDNVRAAGEEAGRALYDITQRALAAAGLPAYEISNHARPGHECRHNLSIWRGGDYVGIGPGAHGRLGLNGGALARYQVHAPARWLKAVEKNGHATAKTTALSPAARAEELLLTGLRLAEGVSRRRVRAVAGLELESVVDAAGLRRMRDGGFVIADDDGIRATATGRPVLNEVLRRLLVRD